MREDEGKVRDENETRRKELYKFSKSMNNLMNDKLYTKRFMCEFY